MAMDVGSWCNSGHKHAGWSRGFSETEHDNFLPFNFPVTGSSKVPIWRLLWRKIKKEKRKIFEISTTVQLNYEPYAYAQNFDGGTRWDDYDDLSHSFSARFVVVPSRIFPKNEELMD